MHIRQPVAVIVVDPDGPAHCRNAAVKAISPARPPSVGRSSAYPETASFCNNPAPSPLTLSRCNNHGNQVASWKHSMQYMNNVLVRSAIARDAGVAIEYKISLTSRRVDFILTGV